MGEGENVIVEKHWWIPGWGERARGGVCGVKVVEQKVERWVWIDVMVAGGDRDVGRQQEGGRRRRAESVGVGVGDGKRVSGEERGMRGGMVCAMISPSLSSTLSLPLPPTHHSHHHHLNRLPLPLPLPSPPLPLIHLLPHSSPTSPLPPLPNAPPPPSSPTHTIPRKRR